ncbi:hypothetical protein [Haloarcula sp. JP-L23]|uniref:DUF7269 family protein n=1 Tax=Haloarcula sp. JP-L23 TaxID=2716717 RepID=UPI00140ED69C|nr:hypothetical protein G9465_18055 [Haloarcula sp. JP-L23]
MSERSVTGVRRLGWYLLVVVGVLAFALAVVPGGSGIFPTETFIDRVGNEYFLLGILGGVGVGVLGWMVVRRAREHVTQADPPEPETVRDAPPPGDEFDRLVEGIPTLSARDGSEDAEQLRQRLRDAVVATMMREEGLSRERANERVEKGAWTDDPVAARFLDETARGPPLSERARLALRGDSWVQYGAKAAAQALTDRIETGEESNGGDDVGSETNRLGRRDDGSDEA